MRGNIEGVSVGRTWRNRQELFEVGAHGHTQAGNSGYDGGQPAESIVISGDYENGLGDLIIYTVDGGGDQTSVTPIRVSGQYVEEVSMRGYVRPVRPNQTTEDSCIRACTTGDPLLHLQYFPLGQHHTSRSTTPSLRARELTITR